MAECALLRSRLGNYDKRAEALSPVKSQGKEKSNRLRRALNRVVVKAHVKDEPYDEIKPVRMINARCDASKALFGPTFAKIEKTVCKLPWFIKYIPVSDRPRAIFDRIYAEGAMYVCTDYSSFEAHFSPAIMWAIEEPLYEYMTSKLPQVDKDVFMAYWRTCIQGRNLVEIRDVFRAELEGTRMSGEMNTSLGNGWSNLVLFMFALYNNGATWDDIFVNIPGFVEGDDGLFRVPRSLAPSSQQMANYGFNLKIDKVSDICEASFCGQVFDPKDLINVTDPIKVLMKLAWLPRKYIRASDKMKKQLLKAKTQSALFQYNGCPLVTSACVNILNQLKNVRFTRALYNQLDVRERDILHQSTVSFQIKTPSVGTRTLVQKLYDISIDDQERLEKQLDQHDLASTLMMVLPTRYDKYAINSLNYIHSPTLPNPAARYECYEHLRGLYMCAGTKLQSYPSLPP